MIERGQTPTPAVQADGGDEVDSTIPSPAGPEVCGNGLDDDGNKQVDEGCACTAGATQLCYPGPTGAKGVGQCKAGSQTCGDQGETEFSSWGPCQGAVLPGGEDCSDGIDNDCNGKVDDGPGCACKPKETRACYSGPPATRGKGQCKDGVETCNPAGTGWDTVCKGEVLPAQEICHDKIDNNCDGQIDEGCVVTVNVNIAGDCVWASCPPQTPHPVGCVIAMAGNDCRGCVAHAPGSAKVYFQEGNVCGSGWVTGQLFCSSVPNGGLNALNCVINKKAKFYEQSPSGCPTSGGDGCSK